jgi:hypothetical protein
MRVYVFAGSARAEEFRFSENDLPEKKKKKRKEKKEVRFVFFPFSR